jgi:hypothetical protein
MLSIRDGRLWVEDCDAEALARRHGTPCYVVSEGQLRANARRIAAAFDRAWSHGPVAVLPSFKGRSVARRPGDPQRRGARLRRLRRSRATRRAAGRCARRADLPQRAPQGRCHARRRDRSRCDDRKGGTRARSYQCDGYKFATGTCDAKPIDAERVDDCVIEGVPNLLLDYDAWCEQIEDDYAAERSRLASEVDRAQRDHDAQAPGAGGWNVLICRRCVREPFGWMPAFSCGFPWV